MRNRIFVLTPIMALVIGATIFAAAQGDAVMAHFQHGGGGRSHSFGPEMVEHIARELNLTEAQKTQIKSLLEAGHATMTALHQKKDELNKQLEEATANGQFDEAQVRALATQQGQLTAETIVEHERMKSKILSLLTPEQRVKANELHKRHTKHLRGSGM